MDKELLSELLLTELRVLCSHRNIKTTSKTVKEAAIRKIVGYHKLNGGVENLKLNELNKEKLIPEAKAVGATNLSSKKKSDSSTSLLIAIIIQKRKKKII